MSQQTKIYKCVWNHLYIVLNVYYMMMTAGAASPRAVTDIQKDRHAPKAFTVCHCAENNKNLATLLRIKTSCNTNILFHPPTRDSAT